MYLKGLYIEAWAGTNFFPLRRRYAFTQSSATSAAKPVSIRTRKYTSLDGANDRAVPFRNQIFLDFSTGKGVVACCIK
jgi:hypothetical protein